jgi:hypothetical protein
LSNSHSGALLTCIDWTTLVGGGSRSTSIGGVGGGDVTSATSLVVFLTLASISGSLGNGLGILLVLVHGPVENIVILEAFANEEIAEDLAQVRVIGFVIEAEGTGVVQVDGKLVGEATAEDLCGGCHLLLHDTVVLLLLGSSLESLPGKGATAEVEHHIAKRLHVVTARLFCGV